MKILSIVLSFGVLFINSCNDRSTSSSKAETLYIKTTSYTGVGLKQVKTDTVSEVVSDYFEVSLRYKYGLESLSEGQYIATKDIIRPTSDENFKNVFLNIVHKDGSLIFFSPTTELLNFMSAHGYEMVYQLKNEDGGDYTFKRKKL